MRSVSLLVAAAVMAGCSTAPQQVGRTVEAEATLDRMLGGRVAGQPLSCLPPYGRNEMVTVDGNTILFRSGSTVYRNDLRSSGCSNLGGGYSLVTQNSGGRLCSGDIAQVADIRNGITVGSCVLGDFVPYTMPRG